MKGVITYLCIIGLCIVPSTTAQDYFKNALDDLEVRYSGPGNHYDGILYNRLVQCFSKYNDTMLYHSQVQAWKGMADYWKNRKTNRDYRGKPDPWGTWSHWHEFYNRPHEYFGRNHVLTLEPCNFASSIVFYRNVLRICEDGDLTLSD